MMKDDELPPELFRVARKKGTEAPFTGKYVNEHAKGMYTCAVCGNIVRILSVAIVAYGALALSCATAVMYFVKRRLLGASASTGTTV